jgi:hypothetical protein
MDSIAIYRADNGFQLNYHEGKTHGNLNFDSVAELTHWIATNLD